MSFYIELYNHNNREKKQIAQYNLPVDFFYRLKVFFSEKITLRDVDARDCTVFYALWWKYEYKEGTPSKEVVFESFKGHFHRFNSDDFFNKAREGARLLNIK